jgi:hypothetical protein
MTEPKMPKFAEGDLTILTKNRLALNAKHNKQIPSMFPTTKDRIPKDSAAYVQGQTKMEEFE